MQAASVTITSTVLLQQLPSRMRATATAILLFIGARDFDVEFMRRPF